MADSDDLDVLFGLTRRSRVDGQTLATPEATLELSRLDIIDAALKRRKQQGTPSHYDAKSLSQPKKKNIWQQQRGIVYFASIPTNMRPNEVKSIFEKFGEIYRQKFVAKSDSTDGRKRSRSAVKSLRTLEGFNSHGGGDVQFDHGWLEFLNAADAHRAATSLNGQPVRDSVKGGVRRKCFGDEWQCKFLGPNFTWGDLVNEKEASRRAHQTAIYRAKQRERRIADAFREYCAAEKAGKKEKISENKLLVKLDRNKMRSDDSEATTKDKNNCVERTEVQHMSSEETRPRAKKLGKLVKKLVRNQKTSAKR